MRLRWVIVSHQLEFLRGLSSAKLVAILLGGATTTATTKSDYNHYTSKNGVAAGAELIVLGTPSHEAQLDSVLRQAGAGHPTRILFPEEGADTVASLAAAFINFNSSVYNDGDGSTTGAPGTLFSVATGSTLTIIVPDGSWAGARAVVAHIRARYLALNPCASSLRSLQLNHARVTAHTSPLIEALRAGAGRGRLTTLEACAMLLEELEDIVLPLATGNDSVGDSNGNGNSNSSRLCSYSASASLLYRGLDRLAARARAIMAPLVKLSSSRKLHAVGKDSDCNGAKSSSPSLVFTTSQIESWTCALQRVAASYKIPLAVRGVRHCHVCGTALATAVILPKHIRGRKHCAAVAHAYLITKSSDDGSVDASGFCGGNSLCGHSSDGGFDRKDHCHTQQQQQQQQQQQNQQQQQQQQQRKQQQLRLQHQQPISDEAASAVFEAHSTRILAQACIEPPDVAFVNLACRLGIAGADVSAWAKS